MTKLSPAAQAVWDAYNDVCERVGVFEDYGDALAAAFRAAANQVVPEREVPRGHFVDLGGGTVEVFPQSARGPIQRLRLLQEVRGRFLGIAAELDGTSPTNQEDYE